MSLETPCFINPDHLYSLSLEVFCWESTSLPPYLPTNQPTTPNNTSHPEAPEKPCWESSILAPARGTWLASWRPLAAPSWAHKVRFVAHLGGGMVALDPKPGWGGKVSVSKVGARVFVQHFLEFFFVCDGWGGVGWDIHWDRSVEFRLIHYFWKRDFERSQIFETSKCSWTWLFRNIWTCQFNNKKVQEIHLRFGEGMKASILFEGFPLFQPHLGEFQVLNHINEVIRFVIFWSPNIGGHQQPFLKGHVFSPSQKRSPRLARTSFVFFRKEKTVFFP